MKHSPLSASPRRVRSARLDNLALVPGNVLPYKRQWQKVANRLPKDAILTVLPATSSSQKEVLLAVPKTLLGTGIKSGCSQPTRSVIDAIRARGWVDNACPLKSEYTTNHQRRLPRRSFHVEHLSASHR